jgi:hypothetical protein
MLLAHMGQHHLVQKIGIAVSKCHNTKTKANIEPDRDTGETLNE